MPDVPGLVSKSSMVWRALLTFSGVLVLAQLAKAHGAEDAFLARHRAEVERNAPTLSVTLRTSAGQMSFQPGERMELVLSVGPAVGAAAATQAVDHRPDITEIVFDRPQDVSTPLSAMDWLPGERVSRGVTCCVTGPPPWSTTFVLNSLYRVHRPGPLRLYVRSRSSHHSMHAEFRTSDVLTIEIQPRDASWEAAVVRNAAAVLEDPHAEQARLASAVASLEMLGTLDGARVLLRRVDAAGLRPPLTALFAVDDRAAAVRLMEEELRRPERPIDGGFVRSLARLARAVRHPDPSPLALDEYLDRIEYYAAMRGRALAGMFGLTAALVGELDGGAKSSWDPFRGPVAPALHLFPQEAAAAFRLLEVDRIESLLRHHGRRFAHPSLLPLLRDLYARWDGLKSVALSPICDVAAVECHGVIRAELARELPQVGIDVMSRLPDAALPEMEEAWVRLLESSVRAEVLVAGAERLERFGTSATASRAARAWLSRHDDWTTDVDGPLLAFLARVAPKLAAPTLAAAAKDPETMRGAGRDSALPLAIATFEWNTIVERFVVEALASDDYDVRRQAARALAAHGSPAGRQAIEAALRRLRASWPPDDGEAERLESDLAEALVTAPGWYLSIRSRAVASAACVGDGCRSALRPHQLEIVEPRIDIAYPGHGQPVAAAFTLDGVSLTSMRSLIAKLRQYRAGTRFYFDPLGTLPMIASEAWTARSRQDLFDQVKAEAGRFGIVVTANYTLAK
jgi:hypothetical protein